MSDEWPKLSESLPHPRDPITCQACGAKRAVDRHDRWQEHDGDDKPTPVVVVLCRTCGGKLIERGLMRIADGHH